MRDLRRIWPVLFLDDFRHRGPNLLDGSASLPDHWTVDSGSFSTSNERYLLATSPGKLIYNGTDLSELTTGANANFGWVVRFFGQTNLIFELHGRRSSSNTYLSVKVDFENNSLQLIKYNGSATVLAERDYSWKTSADAYYSVELWTYDVQAEVRVNDGLAIQVEHDFNTTESGSAIQVNSEGSFRFAKFAAHIIEAWPRPNRSSEDNSNLLLLYRKLMKVKLENPINDWDEYVNARKFWDLQRDLGLSDHMWSSLGYPIREPTTEEWLNPES